MSDSDTSGMGPDLGQRIAVSVAERTASERANGSPAPSRERSADMEALAEAFAEAGRVEVERDLALARIEELEQQLEQMRLSAEAGAAALREDVERLQKALTLATKGVNPPHTGRDGEDYVSRVNALFRKRYGLVGAPGPADKALRDGMVALLWAVEREVRADAWRDAEKHNAALNKRCEAERDDARRERDALRAEVAALKDQIEHERRSAAADAEWHNDQTTEVERLKGALAAEHDVVVRQLDCMAGQLRQRDEARAERDRIQEHAKAVQHQANDRVSEVERLRGALREAESKTKTLEAAVAVAVGAVDRALDAVGAPLPDRPADERITEMSYRRTSVLESIRNLTVDCRTDTERRLALASIGAQAERALAAKGGG